MKWPFGSSKRAAFEQELAAVKSIPDPPIERAQDDNWGGPNYQQGTEPVTPPLSRDNTQTPWARPPQIDRFPTIIGQNLTGQYLSSAMRLCNSGWRYQYVDLVDELLENDPDTRATTRARTIGIACGRYEVKPAELPDSATEAQRDIAKAVADEYALQFSNIPCRTQRIQQLAWGDIYGVSGHEVMWEHPAPNRWDIADLAFIHSRRLNYTNPVSWDLYVYDQGLVGPGSDYMGPTVGVYGLPISKYPGKFLIHTPALSGQYPTRDGEARYILFYLLLKRMVVRCSAQDFERVIRPWVIGYFNRQIPEGHTTPFADRRDIEALNMALGAFGSGSMNWASLPNSVKVEVLRQVAALNSTDFLSFLNRSIAKSLIGQAFTTEPGPNGNLATAEVADKNTTNVLVYSANCMGDTLRRDLAVPWLRLNHPALPRAFAPRHVINVDDLPTPKELIAIAKDATGMDMAVDAGDIAQRTTLKLVSQDDERTPRTRVISAQHGPNPPEPNQEANSALGNKKASAATDAQQKQNQKLNGKPATAEPPKDTN